MSVFETIIKLSTRHLDPEHPLCGKDWRVGNLFPFKEEGYYTRGKWGGARRLGLCLRVDCPVKPTELSDGVVYDLDVSNEPTIMLSRSTYMIDLRALAAHLKLPEEVVQEWLDHDRLKEPVYIAGLPDIGTVIKPYAEFPQLDTSIDRQGTFASGEVDVGPNGHEDANTFYEFESNCAATLTGVLTGNCDEDFDETNNITIAGITTASDKYLEFKTSGAGRNTTGVFSSSYYVLDGNDTGNNITCSIEHFRADGLQFYVPKAGTSSRYGFYATGQSAGSYIKIQNCIAKGYLTGSANYLIAFFLNDADLTADIENCVIHDFGGINFQSMGAYVRGTVDVNNCTISGCFYGIKQLGETITVTNCAVFNNNNDFDGSPTVDHCASDDEDGTNAIDLSPGAPESTEWAKAFTDYSSGDFSVKDTDSVLYHAGVDIGLSTDIVGTAWNDPPSVGAFEYAVGGETYEGTCSDGISFSDQSIRSATFDLIATDGLNLNSTTAKLANFQGASLDSITLAELLSALASYTTTSSDHIILSDSSTKLASFNVTIIDIINTSDLSLAGSSFVAEANDSIDLSDSSLKTITISGTASDSISLSDASIPLGSFLATALSSILLSDSSLRIRDSSKTATDGIVATDTSRIGVSYEVEADDSIDLSDQSTKNASYIKSILDSITISDSSSKIASLLGNSSDGFNLSDSSLSLLSALATALDGITLSDISLTGSFFDGIAEDSLQLSDSSTKLVSFAKTAIDILTMSDTSSSVSTFTISISDSAIFSDIINALAQFTVSVQSGFSLADTVSYTYNAATRTALLTFTVNTKTFNFVIDNRSFSFILN